MRTFIENKAVYLIVLALFTLAFAWNFAHGAVLTSASGAFDRPRVLGQGNHIADGPSIPPPVDEDLRVADGPSIPPPVDEDLRVADGPSIPPPVDEDLRVADGPSIPPPVDEDLRRG